MNGSVVLSSAEIRQAILLGGERYLTVIEAALPPTHRLADEWPYRRWGTDIEGVAAEMAYAKARNRYCAPYVGRDYAVQPGDVGRVQIRSTWHQQGCLTVYENDPDDAPFVLMIGMIPEFRLAGWIYGRHAKRERWLRTDMRKPAYFVPQADLHQFTALAAAA